MTMLSAVVFLSCIILESSALNSTLDGRIVDKGIPIFKYTYDGLLCDKPECNKTTAAQHCRRHACCVSWKAQCLITKGKAASDGKIVELADPYVLSRYFTRQIPVYCCPKCECGQPDIILTPPIWIRLPNNTLREERLEQPGCPKCMNKSDSNMEDCITQWLNIASEDEISRLRSLLVHDRQHRSSYDELNNQMNSSIHRDANVKKYTP